MSIFKKIFDDGSKAERVNHQQQDASENFADIFIGFFSGNLLNRDELKQIYLDVIEYVDENIGRFSENTGNSEEEVQKYIEEGCRVDTISFSNCFLYQRIADSIAKELGDLKIARTVYEKAESLTKEVEDYSCLADSIMKYLRDKNWSKRIMNKGHSLVKNSHDVVALVWDWREN